MSFRTRKPVRMAGALIQSGNIDTGAVAMERAGSRVYTSFSGIGVDTLIHSGQGKLNQAFHYTQIASGRGVIFYDGAAVTSGGPFSASGHKVLGILPMHAAAAYFSGVERNPMSYPGVINQYDFPYYSGLIAAPLAGSGHASFSVSYSPDAVGARSGLNDELA